MNQKKACLYVQDKVFLKNKVFNSIEDDPNKKKFPNQHIIFIELKKKLLKLNIDLSTQDINPPETSIFTIFRTIPLNLNIIDINNSYLTLFETKSVKKRDWDSKLHKYFTKIFTHNTMGKKKFIEFFETSCLEVITKNSPQKNHNIVMISSNKRSSYKNELYFKRYQIIKFFEKNYSKNFKLYGPGWNHFPIYVDTKKDLSFQKIFDFLNKKIRFNSKFQILGNIYQGTIKNKYAILQKYNFSICIQNTYEKNNFYSPIFESFYCSCIPIYQGASNVEDHIPLNCFIDLRKFKNFNSLLNFITNLSFNEIQEYKDNIHQYLRSDQHKKFTNNYQADKIIKNIKIKLD